MDQRRDGRRGGEPQVENWLVGAREAAANVGDQLGAFSRGAEDAFTFGMTDRVRAGQNALIDSFLGKNLGQAYRQRMAFEHAADRYDQQYHPNARTSGKVVGTVGQIALAPEASIAHAGRAVKAADLVGREFAAIAGAGGTAGVAGQAMSDGLSGRKGSLGDYTGAFIGGATGALAARSKLGVVAGATTGGVTSLAQDILNGRIDQGLWNRVVESAAASGALGSIAGRIGRTWSKGLSNQVKGRLGQAIGDLRTRVRGERLEPFSYEKIALSNGQKTIPDARIVGGGTREYKFGDWSRPKGGQRQALKERPDHILFRARPRDVGAAAGAISSALGMPRPPERDSKQED